MTDEGLTFQQIEDAGEEARGPLTPRNRFMLYMSLRNMSGDLDSLAAFWDTWNSQVREDMPRLVHDQPHSWWKQMDRSNERLLEAARTGALQDLVPRTPAEEALLALAASPGYIEWAKDAMRDADLEGLFEDLPTDEDWDGDYEEILPALTGDADIKMLWKADLDGLEDPGDPTNSFLGMGDYRPQAWHRYFDRAIRNLE